MAIYPAKAPEVNEILPGVSPSVVDSSLPSGLLSSWGMTGYHMADVLSWVNVEMGWTNEYRVIKQRR